MYWLYNISFTVLFLLSFPYFFIRGMVGKHGVKQRLGFYSKELREKLRGAHPVWIHAASVGEVKLIPILLEALKPKIPDLQFVITTTTKTGHQEALKLFQGRALAIFYQPVDLPWVTKRVMRLCGPRALLLVETEFWPNLIKSAKEKGAVVGLVNGRVSSRSFSRYSHIRPLARKVLSLVDFFVVQTEKDLHRLNALGAQIHKMKIVGSLKFDQKIFARAVSKRFDRRSFNLPENIKLMVAGSTRPGEEEIILSVFSWLKNENNLKLIVAPRHLDRVTELELLLQNSNLKYVRKSKLGATNASDYEVLLLDTMGELAEIYSLADVAFVGGSLVPLGGHNPLEPAVYGVPVLFGPYMEHSQAAAELLTECGFGFKVRDEEEFYQKAKLILNGGLDRTRLVTNLQKALQKKSGAARKTAEIICRRLRLS